MAPPLDDVGNMCAQAQMPDETHPSSPDEMMKSVMMEDEIFKRALQFLAEVSVASQEKCDQRTNDAVKRLRDKISESKAEQKKHLEEMRRKDAALRSKEQENQAALRSKEQENQTLRREKEEMRREKEEMRREKEEIEALRREEAESRAALEHRLELADRKMEMDEATLKVKEASINVKNELLVQTAAALKESDMPRAAAFAMRGLKADRERTKNELDKTKEEVRKMYSALCKKDKQLERTLKELQGFKTMYLDGVDRAALSLRRGRNP